MTIFNNVQRLLTILKWSNFKSVIDICHLARKWIFHFLPRSKNIFLCFFVSVLKEKKKTSHEETKYLKVAIISLKINLGLPFYTSQL